ncbi:MAG: hypothetical protein RL215_3063 [Planctomycetota bacterium]|jgi:hypothetical protein
MKNLLKMVCLTATVISGSVYGGSGDGPKVAKEIVEAHSTDAYMVTFRAGEPASVVVIGDGDTDLDLRVYDENGNLVASDLDSTDRCIVNWCPRWTGKFRILVQNLGSVYNRYEIATN